MARHAAQLPGSQPSQIYMPAITNEVVCLLILVMDVFGQKQENVRITKIISCRHGKEKKK